MDDHPESARAQWATAPWLSPVSLLHMPRSYIPHTLRQEVLARAGGRCEYCLLHHDDRPESHQVDHIVARKHGGQTVRENLALACAQCNNNKGSDLATLDWTSGQIVSLFNPRQHNWHEHFRCEGAQIVGNTAIGRATVRLLRLNAPERVASRQILIEAGLYPP